MVSHFSIKLGDLATFSQHILRVLHTHDTSFLSAAQNNSSRGISPTASWTLDASYSIAAHHRKQATDKAHFTGSTAPLDHAVWSTVPPFGWSKLTTILCSKVLPSLHVNVWATRLKPARIRAGCFGMFAHPPHMRINVTHKISHVHCQKGSLTFSHSREMRNWVPTSTKRGCLLFY